MPFSVVLDTCVLFPAHLRDTMLRLAERGLFHPLWSAEILDELRRALVRHHVAKAHVDRLLDQMTEAFEHSLITGYEATEATMTNHPKDRHVLAAAVHSRASAVVTFNTRDFPDDSVRPHDIEAIAPGTFLLDQLDLAPTALIDVLMAQAAANRRAPKTLPNLLDALSKAGVPDFADEIRRRTR
jgi:predicted nucleic acid-binding protein